MYKRILVPLDGSVLSERVLPLARQLAQSFGSIIDLIYVVQQPSEEISEEVTPQDEENGNDYLGKIAKSISADIEGIKAEYSVQTGYPASMIIEQAESQDKTLILMSTHGYSGLQRLLLGSVAGKVVQASKTPVLLVPAGAQNAEGQLVEFKRVIVPLDGSKLAECVLPFVINLCKLLDMELILVRAYHPNFPGSSIRMHDVSQIVHDSAENYVKEKVQQLQNKGLKKVSYKVLRGLPAEQITDFAIETENSLTAMSTHGRHGIGRWMLGSVTDAVIHCSEEPVLVFRGVEEGCE